jgi:hypothetical protein
MIFGVVYPGLRQPFLAKELGCRWAINIPPLWGLSECCAWRGRSVVPCGTQCLGTGFTRDFVPG